MVNKRKKYAFLSLMMVITIACGFSFGENLSEEEKLQTVVAETVAANQAQQDDEPEAPLPTITTAPDEPQPSGPPTKTPLPCNKADFVSETVEDGTQYGINENFTKTWRLKNIGTCTSTTWSKLGKTSWSWANTDSSSYRSSKGGSITQNTSRTCRPSGAKPGSKKVGA